MSNRWKFQLKIGFYWGTFMTLFMLLFYSKEVAVLNQIKSSQFYLKSIGHFLIGIFIMGYIWWKEKNIASKKD